MPQQLNSNNLEIRHEARAQLRGKIVASVSASKIARVLQVLIFAVSCLFASNLPAQNLQTATQTIAHQAKNSQTATQEQNAKNSQNAAQSQNAQDLQIAPQVQDAKDSQIAAQELDAKDLQTTAKSQAAQDLTAPQEKKEEKMQKCDFYPVTDLFSFMEKQANINKLSIHCQSRKITTGISAKFIRANGDTENMA